VVLASGGDSVTDNRTEDKEIEMFMDFLPNWVKHGQVAKVEGILRKRFDESLPSKIARYGELPTLHVQVKLFHLLIREARSLYVDGYARGAIALCGMTVEALCIAIAEDRVKDEPLKRQLTNPQGKCRRKINHLEKYFRISKSALWLHQVLDIRNDYLHLHKIRVPSEDVLEAINRLHLAVLAEYGLFSRDGKWRYATEEDIIQFAKRLGYDKI